MNNMSQNTDYWLTGGKVGWVPFPIFCGSVERFMTQSEQWGAPNLVSCRRGLFELAELAHVLGLGSCNLAGRIISDCDGRVTVSSDTTRQHDGAAGILPFTRGMSFKLPFARIGVISPDMTSNWLQGGSTLL